MSQPQFADGPSVPLMTEGLIDAAVLRQLAGDLEIAAEVLGVQEKVALSAHSAPDQVSFAGAIDRLLTGVSRAAQIRYRYEAQEWTDTIMAMKDGYRVVRCRHNT
jgi:hypothetical protein